MAVPEGERGKTPLEALVLAQDLATYTIRITKNQKIFLPEYQSALTDDIINTAKHIFTDAWKANNIKCVKAADWRKRKELQKEAALGCNDLLATIQLAKTVFHLKSKRVKYWSEKCITVRKKLRDWTEGDEKRYKGLPE